MGNRGPIARRLAMSLSVVLVAVSCCNGAKAQLPEQRGAASAPAEVHGPRFYPFASPQGRFTMAIPDGWVFRSFMADESIIGVTPKGQNFPEIAIGFTEVSVMALQVGSQSPEWNAKQFSAREFIERLFFPILRRARPDARIESLRAPRGAAAEAVFAWRHEGRPMLTKLVATMDYLPDPTLRPTWGWGWNFVYMNSITAAPIQIPSLESLAAAVFRSFRPTDRWIADVLVPILQGMQVRQGMISSTVQRINAMEMQQRMAEMQSMTDTGRKWAHTLGGTVELRSPRTNDTWRVTNSHKYYFLEGGRPFGTNDPTQLKLPGRQPLSQ